MKDAKQARKAQTREQLRQEQLENFMTYRVRLLPEQLERAYRRVEHLENEARRIGLGNIVREK